MLQHEEYTPTTKSQKNRIASRHAEGSRDDTKLELVKRGAPLYIKWMNFARRDNDIPAIQENLLRKIEVLTNRDKRAIYFVQNKVPNVQELALAGQDIPTAYASYINAKRRGNRKTVNPSSAVV